MSTGGRVGLRAAQRHAEERNTPPTAWIPAIGLLLAAQRHAAPGTTSKAVK